eukprot:XP_013992095.1 PREDICTED: ubiquitin-conjugating enzyme E2 G1 isoform X1 [Salmo salar]
MTEPQAALLLRRQLAGTFGGRTPRRCISVQEASLQYLVRIQAASHPAVIGSPVGWHRELNKNPVEGFSAGLIDDNDLYRWEVLIIGPPDTCYEGGVFKAHLTFPKDYPLRPPKMKFITDIWHPNVDKNGDVCISILHEPGEDKYGYEKPEERWLPIHTVETIMISVISMLADPNGDSPANVDAAKEWREDRHGEFKRKVARCVRKSQETAFE